MRPVSGVLIASAGGISDLYYPVFVYVGLVESGVQYETYTGTWCYEQAMPELRALLSTFNEIFTTVGYTMIPALKVFETATGRK